MRARDGLFVEARRFWMAAALLVTVQTVALCAQPVWERVPLSPPPNSGEPVGVWSGGAYLAIENHSSAAPMLLVYNQSGELLQRVTIGIPGAGHLLVLTYWFAHRAERCPVPGTFWSLLTGLHTGPTATWPWWEQPPTNGWAPAF